MDNRLGSARVIALGGVLAALAVTVMGMGTIIPVATYVCPVICMVLLQVVLKICGKKTAWAWYGAVSILSLLLAPDKEAALVYVFLGYYPILKLWIDQSKGKWIWKALYFNASVFLAYYLMINLFGLEQVLDELSGAGTVMTGILLLLGNVTFFLLDKVLSMGYRKIKKR